MLTSISLAVFMVAMVRSEKYTVEYFTPVAFIATGLIDMVIAMAIFQ